MGHVFPDVLGFDVFDDFVGLVEFPARHQNRELDQAAFDDVVDSFESLKELEFGFLDAGVGVGVDAGRDEVDVGDFEAEGAF